MAEYNNVPHGITEDTPKNILLGAGTIHSGLSFGEHYAVTADTEMKSGKTYYQKTGDEYKEVTESSFVVGNIYYEKFTGWNFAESVLGATSGGTKISIKPEIKDIELDGALVKVMNLAVKIGETATMETTYAEATAKNMSTVLLGKTTRQVMSGLDAYITTPKKRIEEGDYIKDLAFVGSYTDGRPVIIIFDYALCTSGLEVEAKNKENATIKATFECYAPISSDCDTLPYRIYELSESTQ